MPKTDAKNVTDQEMEKASLDTGALLAEQKKVKVKLFLDPAEKKRLTSLEESGATNIQWPCEVVGINGYNFTIKRGVEVEVPQTVADVLENAGMI